MRFVRTISHLFRVWLLRRPCPRRFITWQNIGMRMDGDYDHEVHVGSCEICGTPHVKEMGMYRTGVATSYRRGYVEGIDWKRLLVGYPPGCDHSRKDSHE